MSIPELLFLALEATGLEGEGRFRVADAASDDVEGNSSRGVVELDGA